MVKKIRCEKDLSEWFIKNFKKLGYQKIIKDNNGRFPDFTMLKNGKEVGVELEILSSGFLWHKHDITKVKDVVCLRKDAPLKANVIELPYLNYAPRVVRMSATIEKETKNKINEMMKSGEYRNVSHLVESAIHFLVEKEFGREIK